MGEAGTMLDLRHVPGKVRLVIETIFALQKSRFRGKLVIEFPGNGGLGNIWKEEKLVEPVMVPGPSVDAPHRLPGT